MTYKVSMHQNAPMSYQPPLWLHSSPVKNKRLCNKVCCVYLNIITSIFTTVKKLNLPFLFISYCEHSDTRGKLLPIPRRSTKRGKGTSDLKNYIKIK